MGHIDSGGRESHLSRSLELQDVAEGRDLNRAPDPARPNRGGDRRRNLEHVDAGRQVAVLEVPPHRDPDAARPVVFPPRRRTLREVRMRVIAGRRCQETGDPQKRGRTLWRWGESSGAEGFHAGTCGVVESQRWWVWRGFMEVLAPCEGGGIALGGLTTQKAETRRRDSP